MIRIEVEMDGRKESNAMTIKLIGSGPLAVEELIAERLRPKIEAMADRTIIELDQEGKLTGAIRNGVS